MTNKNEKLKQKTYSKDREKIIDDQYINDVRSNTFIGKLFFIN